MAKRGQKKGKGGGNGNGRKSKALVVKEQTAAVEAGLQSFMAPRIRDVLPKHVSIERFNQVLLHSLTRDPYLLECDRASLYSAALSAATLGLVCDGVLGESYLVAFGGVVQLIPGYRGLIKLATQSGEVKKIEAHVVREGDLFDYVYGTGQRIDHKEAPADQRGEITHAWARAILTNGEEIFEVMAKPDVDRIRDMAAATRRGRAGPAWEKHYPEMARKTAVRRLAKYLPLSVESRRFHEAVAMEQNYEGGKATYLDKSGLKVIDLAPDPEPDDGKDDLDRFASEPPADEPPPVGDPIEEVDPETGEVIPTDLSGGQEEIDL